MSEKDGTMVWITPRGELMPSGSDMHVLLTGDMGYSKFSKPFILGHECAGIVAKGMSSSTFLPEKLTVELVRTSRASKSAIGSL
jgi:hypothetical protein